MQTIIYLPHFLSWITIYALVFLWFSDQGPINTNLRAAGFPTTSILQEPDLFRPIIILQQIWRDSGWGTIIILAALSGIRTELLEAAMIDGANRWQQTLYITLPGIKSTILILLILRMGDLLHTGFEQIFVMQNPLNYSVSDVLETYTFRTGLLNGNLSYATAAGLFQSLIAIVMVLGANWLVKRLGEEGLW